MDINQIKDILLKNNQNREFIYQLNNALKALIGKDNSFIGQKAAPTIWECKWLNRSSIEGYQKGQAVWLNTNTYDQIVLSKHAQIQSYIDGNPILRQLYNDIDKDNQGAVRKFLLAAANGTASNKVSALYYLGDVKSNAQVRVSTIDNNKSYPSDDSSWKDFYSYMSYDDNCKLMYDCAESAIAEAIGTHVQQYHPTNSDTFDSSLHSMGFFKKTPFEISAIQSQSFYSHTYCTSMEGFDYVKQWKTSDDGMQWCKIWNSGYVEQGGFAYNIPGQALIPIQFMATYNYPIGPSFYQRGYSTYDSTYSIDSSLQANNRYVVTITPVLIDGSSPYPQRPTNVGGELIYSSVDATNMSNTGFSIVNTDILAERYIKYCWHVCGYKILQKDSPLFDNDIANIYAPAAAFGILGNTLTSFSNKDYLFVKIPENVYDIDYGVFQDCSSIKSFIFPSKLSSIDIKAFEGCSGMQGIALPNSLKTIDDEAFYNCQSLAYVNMGENVNFVGTRAFYEDTSLQKISRLEDEDSSHTFDIVGDYAFAKTAIKKANLALRSSSIFTFWGDYCFASCMNLEEVNILSSCYMSTHMFDNCTKLSSVNFKNNKTSYVYPNVFDGCTALTSITLPSQIWYISEEMFKNCTSLKHVKFSDYSQTSSAINLIQKNAFNGCTHLQSLEVPASLTSLSQLDDACLSGCALTSISLHGIKKSDIMTNVGQPVDALSKTGMFRLNHSCKITCKDGETFNFIYDPAKTTPYSDPVNYVHMVDKTTTSGFKTPHGNDDKFTWYYNAIQLKAQADRDGIPCLFIYSLLGCDPCQIYSKNIFNNASFQTWAAKQKFYMCNMEVDKQPYYDQQLNFCVNDLVPNADNIYFYGDVKSEDAAKENSINRKYFVPKPNSASKNSNLMTPVLVFYHKPVGATVATSYVYSYHDISTWINNFGAGNLNAGIEKVIEMLKSWCLYHFDNNTPSSSGFVVDAQPFEYDDYFNEDFENPYAIDDGYTIVPKSQNDEVLDTLDKVKNDIINRLNESSSQFVVDSTPYLGGCTFDEVPYLALTFKNIDECYSPVDANALISRGNNIKYKFKIGNSFYKFSLDTNDTIKRENPCSEGLTIEAGAPIWTALS